MGEQSMNETGVDVTRERIIEAAFKLFGKVGYSRATTRAIAAEAGVNEVTIFRHFGSKKNLLIAVVDAVNAEAFPANFERLLTGNYAEDIRIMAQAQIVDMAGGFDALRMMMCDASQMPEIRNSLMDGVRHNLSFLVDYFRRQIEAGVVRSELNPQIVAQAFDNMFSSFVFFQLLFQASSLSEMTSDAILLPLVDIFVRGTISEDD